MQTPKANKQKTDIALLIFHKVDFKAKLLLDIQISQSYKPQITRKIYKFQNYNKSFFENIS